MLQVLEVHLRHWEKMVNWSLGAMQHLAVPWRLKFFFVSSEFIKTKWWQRPKDDDDKTKPKKISPSTQCHTTSSQLRQSARSETNFNVTSLRPAELNHQSVGEKKPVLSFWKDARRWQAFTCEWVWNFWLRTWRSALCGHGQAWYRFSQILNVMPVQNVRVQIFSDVAMSFWNTMSHWEKDTNRQVCQTSTWSVHLNARTDLATFRMPASCGRLFQRRPFEEKVAQGVGAQILLGVQIPHSIY